MIAAIKAFFDAIGEMMKAYEAKVENQTTSEVVKDKKSLKKASNITEEILLLTDKYTYAFTERDLNKYNRLKRDFLKVN